jgi:hypothetical protein
VTDSVESTPDHAPPAGWYADPDRPGYERRWTGDKWSIFTRKAPRAESAPPQLGAKANRLAVTALILSSFGLFFVGSILGIVFGTVALDEIRGSDGHERGERIARWAVGIGWATIILWVAVIVFAVAVLLFQ